MRVWWLLLLLVGCGNASGDAGPALPDGETIYMRACAVCHGAEGTGTVGKFPPLVAPRRAAKDIQIATVLHGVRGMPPHHDLSDAEVAAVLTFIRTSWGNALDPVRPADVARSRF